MNNRIWSSHWTMAIVVITACGMALASCVSVRSHEQIQPQVTDAKVAVSSLIDPQLLPMVAAFEKHEAGATPLSLETLPTVRRASAMSIEPLPQPQWSERLIPGRGGAPDVRIYIINAGSRGSVRPAILHVHGGGYVLGAAKDVIRGLQEFATKLDCVVVSVDYRLAPETHFPGSLEDNYAGLKWLYDNAADLGVDRSRIAVMGESAGGGHAAMLAIAARDRHEVPLAYQALIYPMLDDRTASTRDVPPHIGTILWTRSANRFGWSSLLGVPAGSKHVPDGAVPARVANLAGLPPAFIGVGTLDLFVSEDIEYSRRLIEAGVNVELLVVPGAFHGFDNARDADVAKQFRAALMNALARAFKKA